MQIIKIVGPIYFPVLFGRLGYEFGLISEFSVWFDRLVKLTFNVIFSSRT